MPRSKFPTRAQQASATGLGKQFTSPIKHSNQHKTTTYVQYMGQKQEISRLRAKIAMLKRQAKGSIDSPPLHDTIGIPEPSELELSASDEPTLVDEDVLPGPECVSLHQEDQCRPCCTVPNQEVKDSYANWMNLLT